MTHEREDLGQPGPTPHEVEMAETRARLTELQAGLGFSETEGIGQIRVSLIEAMSAGDHEAIKKLLGQYQMLGEAEVEKLKDEAAFNRAQIGLIIATGILWLDAGRINNYGNELYNARQYAQHMNFEDAALVLDRAYKEVEIVVDESVESDYVGPPTEELVAVAKRELPEELHEEIDYLLPLPPDEALEELGSIMGSSEVDETPYEFFARMGWIEGEL